MNEGKLIAYAWEAGSEDYFADDPRRDAFEEGFMRGARWHESLPLSEKLSERDKAKIIMLQEEIHGEIMRAHDDDDWPDAAHYILDAMPRTFEKVFGKNLFTPTEQ